MNIPTLNIYLSADEYRTLVHEAEAQKIRVSLLVRKIVREHLQGRGEKREENM